MEIKYSILPSGLYIYLCGELDDCNSLKVREKIDGLIDEYALRGRSVIFNMRNLSFMDSTGIGMIIGRYKKLKKMNVSVFIQSPSFSADKIFQTSGIYSLIPKI